MTLALLAILLSAHLLCMNVASAGPLVCIWLDSLTARGNTSAGAVGRWLAWKSCQLLLAGTVFGLAVGWLRWDAEFAAVLQRFSSRITWGIAELVFSLALLVGYAAWLSARPQATMAGRWARSLLAILSATNLLYHFPTLFALIAKAHAGRIEAVTIDSPTFRRLIADSDVLAMTAHFGLASIAVTGVALIVFTWSRGGDTEKGTDCVAVWGGRIALGSTVLQIPVGIWLLLSVPPIPQQRLLGGDVVGSSLFVLSMAGVLALLHLLAAVAFGNTTRTALLRTIQGMVLLVVVMTGVLQRLNQ